MATNETTRRDACLGGRFGPFLWGALVGATLGLLFAPARGRTTRERLEVGVRERRDQAAETVERGKAAVGRASARLRDQSRHVTQAVKEARAALTDMRGRGEDALKNIRREAGEAVAEATTAYRDARAELTGGHEQS